MPNPSFSLKTKALTIVPVALLSGAWTVSLVNVSADATGTGNQHHLRLPNGVDLPSEAIQAPASIPQPNHIAPGVPQGSVDAVVSGASTSGIPAVALAAYQRGAQIIDAADKSCNVPWELLAAIGRVESNHGRYGGSVLTSKGVEQPGIVGPLLDGRHDTRAITDTDGGRLDGNTQYDRAVGPMQFLPSTWEVVKVDADGDGQRNPQDINDAALATAVYLCSGRENLSTRSGQETAVYRYNRSPQYVDLVLRIMEAYASGDYTAVPSGSYGGNLFAPSYSSAASPHKHPAKTRRAHGAPQTAAPHHRNGGQSTGGTSTHSGSGDSGTGSGSSPIPGTSGGGDTGGGTTNKAGNALGDTIDKVASAVPTPLQSPVADLITQAEAATLCSDHFSGIAGLLKSVPLVGNVYDNALTKCEDNLSGQQQADSGSLLGNIPTSVKGVLSWLGIG